MMNPLPLLTTSRELRYFAVTAEPNAVAEAIRGWSDAGLVTRIVRGHKMRTWNGVFDEFAAALQFPWYFGENVDALKDCITDLDWLPPQAGYVITINNAGDVLVDAEPGALDRLVGLLDDSCEEWAEPVEQGEWWDRPGVPFHVVLHVTGDSTAALKRWTAAGGDVVPFPT